ncbi:MAG: copper-binding protein [Steroidobacteraceae bacterium]|nr:copper-binding protein [Steroidobacteraceae bacterium]
MNPRLTLILILALASGPAAAEPATDTTGPHLRDHPAAQAAVPVDAAAPATAGEVRKVDVAAQKITIKHGAIENLGMSAMTMVFRVSDPAMLTAVKAGDQVKMTVERVNGVLTIVALQRVPPRVQGAEQ